MTMDKCTDWRDARCPDCTPELTTQDWEPYRGNNHLTIKRPDVTNSGCVDLVYWIGKPLCQALWVDLVHRLTISGLNIYRPSDEIHPVGKSQGHCTIFLDYDDLVKQILLWPHQPLRT